MTTTNEAREAMIAQAQEQAMKGDVFPCCDCGVEKDRAAYGTTQKGKRKLRCDTCEIEKQDKRDRRPAIHRSVEAPEVALPKKPDEKLTLAVALRMQFYKCAALDCLWDLANMPVSGNSGQNQIKYLACCKLIGPMYEEGLHPANADNIGATLEQLRNLYHTNAPRIKKIREVEFEQGEQVINQLEAPQ